MLAEPTVDISAPADAVRVLVDAGRRGPTARDTITGTLIVLGYREVDALAHDRRLAGVGLTWFDLMGIHGPLRDWYGDLLFTNEGEEHLRMRRLVSRAFTPRAIERLRDFAREIIEDAFAPLERAGKGDLVPAFARLGTRVMCRLLGVPQEDVDVFAGWNDALSRTFGFMDAAQIQQAADALGALTEYVRDLVDRRYDQPADDLITALLRAEHEGDTLTRREVVTMVGNLLVAAHDTTASQLGCSFLTLLRHPDALDRLRRGESKAPEALTETMRFEPAIPMFPRTATTAVEIAGVERPAGTMVLLSVASANRDVRIFADPDRFDVDRFVDREVPQPLSFGSGPHFCLGSNLAKMAMEEAITRLAASDLRLDDATAIEWQSVLGRGPARLYANQEVT